MNKKENAGKKLYTREAIELLRNYALDAKIYNLLSGDYNGDKRYLKLFEWYKDNIYCPKFNLGDVMSVNPLIDTLIWDIALKDYWRLLFPFFKLFTNVEGTRYMQGSGTSMQTMLHMRQNKTLTLAKVPSMFKFDYGNKEENEKRYGDEYKGCLPVYKDWKIDWCPIQIVTGEKDLNCGSEQAQAFADKVNSYKKENAVVVREVASYSHLTFLAPRYPQKL